MSSSNVPAIIRWDQAYNRNRDPKLPRAVVNAIRTHANNHTLEAWVKAQTLADYTGLQERAIWKQIAANVKAGWIEIVKSGNSSGLANRYRLTYPSPVLQDIVPPETKGVLEGTTGVPQDMVNPVPQDIPTTPSNYSVGTTEGTSTRENPVLQDRVPTDPFGSGGISSSDRDRRSTGQSNPVLQDTLPGGLGKDPWENPQDSGDPNDPWSKAFVPATR
jgi:hypothetical protein